MKNFVNIGNAMIIGDRNIKIMKDDDKNKELVEEESKLEEVRKSLDETNRALKSYSNDKKDSIFWKQILASSIFGSVLLLDTIACIVAALNPMVNEAVKFIIKASAYGFGLSGLLAGVLYIDRQILKKKITAFKIEIGRLSKEENEIKNKIDSLKTTMHLSNDQLSTKFDEDKISEDVNRKVDYLKEEKAEKVKIKTLGSK